MLITDTVTLVGDRRTTQDGYLVAAARIARTGVQTYSGAEMGRTDLATVRVWRPGGGGVRRRRPGVDGAPPGHARSSGRAGHRRQLEGAQRRPGRRRGGAGRRLYPRAAGADGPRRPSTPSSPASGSSASAMPRRSTGPPAPRRRARPMTPCSAGSAPTTWRWSTPPVPARPAASATPGLLRHPPRLPPRRTRSRRCGPRSRPRTARSPP